MIFRTGTACGRGTEMMEKSKEQKFMRIGHSIIFKYSLLLSIPEGKTKQKKQKKTIAFILEAVVTSTVSEF